MGERKTGGRVDASFQCWDLIRDMNEAFEIVDIRGLKELGNSSYYLVQYEPKILDLHE